MFGQTLGLQNFHASQSSSLGVTAGTTVRRQSGLRAISDIPACPGITARVQQLSPPTLFPQPRKAAWRKQKPAVMAGRPAEPRAGSQSCPLPRVSFQSLSFFPDHSNSGTWGTFAVSGTVPVLRASLTVGWSEAGEDGSFA